MMDLRAERDYWHAYAKQLEAVLAPIDELPFVLRRLLTKSQAKMLSALIACSGVVTYERLRLAIYGDKDPGYGGSCSKIFVMQARRSLRPYGIEIINHWGAGYELAPPSREIIKHLRQQGRGKVRGMIERECLPDRRQSEVIAFRHKGIKYYVTAGYYPDGRLGEIFLSSRFLDSSADDAAKDQAIAGSLALQFGCPPETLRKALLANEDGAAAGPLRKALDVLLAPEGSTP